MVDTILANEGGILDRIQKTFKPEDMTQSRLEEWLTMGEKGRHQVGKGKGEGMKWVDGKMLSSTRQKISRASKILSETSNIYKELDKARDIEDYEKVIKKAKKLYVHEDTIIIEAEPILNTLRQELRVDEKITKNIETYDKKLEPYRDLSEEELLALYKEGRTKEERELSGVVLGEIAPKTLASLKGWDIGLRRKIPRKDVVLAFQSLFE